MRRGRRAGRKLICGRGWYWLIPLLFATQASAKFVNVPVCFQPFDPPATEMRVYEGEQLAFVYGTSCPVAGVAADRCTGRPFWAAAGGLRSSFFYASLKDDQPLSISVVQGGVEGPRSNTAKIAGTGPVECWNNLGAPSPAYTAAALQSPSQKLAELSSACLADAACSGMVFQRCLADGDCKNSLAPLLRTDFNEDGLIDATDAAWWAAALAGAIR